MRDGFENMSREVIADAIKFQVHHDPKEHRIIVRAAVKLQSEAYVSTLLTDAQQCEATKHMMCKLKALLLRMLYEDHRKEFFKDIEELRAVGLGLDPHTYNRFQKAIDKLATSAALW